MRQIFKAGASAAVLLGFVVAAPGLSKAADVVDPGCTLHGAVTLGYMFTGSNVSVDTGGPVFDEDINWQTPFGEGAGLVSCDVWNFQADLASYAHSTDFINGKDLDDTEGHFGGAAFWRDPDMGALGVSASLVNQEILGKDNDYWRVGAFGDFYVNDQFTLGGGVHYFDSNDLGGKDHDGFEFTANAKYYVMPELSLLLQGDYMASKFHGSGDSVNFDGFAVTGEAKYLVWDEGLSVFGGARYAERTLGDGGDDLKIKDMQGFVGMEFAFGGGSGSSLVASDRSGKYDNTSVMLEKLPNLYGEIIGAAAAAGEFDEELEAR